MNEKPRDNIKNIRQEIANLSSNLKKIEEKLKFEKSKKTYAAQLLEEMTDEDI